MSIMLRLKNVKNGGLIIADCYPEDSQVVVYIGVIGNDQSTFRDTFDGHEGEYTGYLSHAR